MEIQRLQITVEREIQARQQVEKQMRQIRTDLIQKTELVFDWFFSSNDFYLNREIVRLKEENEFIRKELANERSKYSIETKIESKRSFTSVLSSGGPGSRDLRGQIF